ncbi:hypothetical protein ACWKWU_01125 [Chitinophaga lutea]
MNKTKLFSGLAVLLFATIGAFATAKQTSFAQVFYQSGASCLSAQATPCPNIGAPDCVILVQPDNGAPALTTQAFATPDCQTAYRQ